MKHWKATEEFLRQAAAALPQEYTAQALEYIDHNELGLALENLSEIAEGLGIVTAEFWRPMAKAGTLMVEATYENH
jgi:hypothetical protein